MDAGQGAREAGRQRVWVCEGGVKCGVECAALFGGGLGENVMNGFNGSVKAPHVVMRLLLVPPILLLYCSQAQR